MGHPQIRWSVLLMTQHEGMPAELQGNGVDVGTLPLKAMECGKESSGAYPPLKEARPKRRCRASTRYANTVEVCHKECGSSRKKLGDSEALTELEERSGLLRSLPVPRVSQAARV